MPRVPSKAQKTTKAKQADLAQYGRYLSGQDVVGSADRKASASANRTKNALNTYYTTKGGGQSRTAPKVKGKSTVSQFVGYKGGKQMSPVQKMNSFARPSMTGTWNLSARNRKGK